RAIHLGSSSLRVTLSSTSDLPLSIFQALACFEAARSSAPVTSRRRREILPANGLNALHGLNVLNLLLTAQMPGKKPEGPRPRSARRMLAVIPRAEIGESVGRVRVGMKFVRLPQPRQLGVEFLHVRGRRIFIVRAEVTQDRTVNVLGALERRGPLAPRGKWIAAVVHHARFDLRIHRR